MSQELPFLSGLHQFLEAAHIISLLLNGFDENQSSELVDSDFFLFKLLDCFVLQYKAAITWTGIDLDKLVRLKINTLENVILICHDQHLDFGHYRWYLDKDAVCCLLDSLFLTK